jgi:hypothetical protein
MTFELPVPESPARKSFGIEQDRWTRWFETAVTAATGLAAIVLVSLVASAFGLT